MKFILALSLFTSSCYCQVISGMTFTGAAGNGQGNQQQAPAPAPPPITYSTVISSLTASNTSACNATSLASYCGFAFTAWSDARVSFTPLTNPYNAAPMAISKGRGTAGDVHNLTSLNVPILAHTQFWFTNNGSGTATRDAVSYPYDGSHLKNGVTTNNQTYITAMVQDLWDRGFDGLLGNWKGGANTCTYPTFNSACGSSTTNTQRDGAYSKAIATMLANHPTMKFGFVYDSSAFASECSSDANEPKCVQLKMDADLDYADTAYFASANYIKDASSKPIVLFFIDESGYFSQCTGGAPCNLTSGTCVSQSACWTSVWSGVNSHTTAQGVPLAMVFENSGGFSHTQSAGAFAWQQPPNVSGASITQSTQEDWKGGTYLDNWYNNANTTYASKLAFGLALKGFDSETASWYYPNGRVIAQQCGQVWLNSFAMNNGHPNVNYIQVSTWDDYEEGSEIETGIDNCFSAPTLSLASSTLTITLHKTDATYATTNTISSLKVWVSQDSTNYALLDTLPVLTTSVNLASYGVLTVGQTYQFKIQAVGQPGISNQISAATSYTR
jgi:hypothetical protein